jgi:CubicO group peptidase (beta-lactamase class C family)
VEDAVVEGSCDPGFAPVRDAFCGNFGDRGELGRAVCVMVDGRVVVDLRGGWADPARSRRWRPDTLVNVFSVGKGLVAACAARLAGQGRLDLDATVASCWPEFGAAGKDAITVRQLLSHQAGLPAVRRRLPSGSMLDWPVMTAALAAQEPWWEPGTGHGYHVNTFGFLVGEVIRRSTGSTVGTVLGSGQDAFGHFGAGGSLGFCDPEGGVAFGYVMNQMGPRWQNPRTRALVDAVYTCL